MHIFVDENKIIVDVVTGWASLIYDVKLEFSIVSSRKNKLELSTVSYSLEECASQKTKETCST